MQQGPRRADRPWLASPPRGRDRVVNGWGGQGIEYCQWIEGEPSAEDSCKCGKPLDRALDAAVAQGQGLRSIPYCDAHLARAYLPHALHWLKLREFSDAAKGIGAASESLEPHPAALAPSILDPRISTQARSARPRSHPLAREQSARDGGEDPRIGCATAREAGQEPTP